MIAIPLTGQQRERVVASPSYLATHCAPTHPVNWSLIGVSAGALPRTLPLSLGV